MSDTPLYVSVATNGILAVLYIAQAWKKQVEVNGSVIGKLLKDVELLTGRVRALEDENELLKLSKLEADRARIEAEMSAKQCAAAERRSKALYNELHDLYTAITGTHHGISMRPKPPSEEDAE